jgi:Porin PorA
MATRRSRWPIVVGVIGVLLLLGALLWVTVAEPALVKYPTDLDETAHAEGTIRFFLDPETRAPVDPPIEEELIIDRRLTVEADASDGEIAVVDEIDEQMIGGEPSELRQRYVIDRTTLENVEDDRAFAYDEANVTDRSPAFSINLPLDAGDGPYDVWKNETGATYEFTATEEYEVDGVEIRLFEGSATDVPVTDAYIAALEPQGVPTALTLDELRPILSASGLDLDALLAALLPNLAPGDTEILLGIANEPVPLTYVLSVTAAFGVEPRTGAIVDLQQISQTVSARPDTAVLDAITGVLERYPQVPAAVNAIETLQGFATGPPIDVFEISYAQTEESRSETVETANDLAGQIALAQRTIPIGLLIAGIIAVLIGIVGFVLGRRRGGPEEPAPEPEPEPAPEPEPTPQPPPDS